MKIDVVMPQMGESITEGTIAKWLKKEGEKVERDEAILEITTDKIDSEIPAPESGILTRILHQEGETVQVGTVLAQLDTEAAQGKVGETVKEAVAEKRGQKEERKEQKKEEPSEPKRSISPVARTIAEKEGLSPQEIQEISGSGQRGRITKEDVLKYLETRQEGGEPEREEKEAAGTVPAAQIPRMTFKYDEERVQVIPMTPMRKRIAEHMVYSKHVSPHTYTVGEVDMTRIVQFREQVKREFEREEGFKLTYTPFILDATVQALKEFPLMNSSVEGDNIIRKEYIHLGIAVALEEGLLVPVIKDADEKNLLGLARSAYELAERARTKKLRPEDVEGGTFTVTNPGIFGNIFGLPIINQPQVGILGVGAIKKRPVVIGDAIGIRSVMYLSLSYDHRVVDGALAGRFVQQIRAGLEDYDVERAL